MKVRLLSSIVLLPLLAVIYFGGPALWIAGLIIGVFGIIEFYKGFETIGIKPSKLIGVTSTFALYEIIVFDRLDFILLWLFLVVASGSIYLFKIEKRELVDGMATITGIFYVSFFSFHVILIDKTEASILIWLAILSAFGTDIFAYFTGFLIGKHKLCPKISPKKTIEGAIGGILGSVVLCWTFGYFFINDLIYHCVIIGFIGSIAAQLGDLTASVFKRKMGIKDYGNLIPGHGGILDRFDSVLFTSPFVYYYIVLVIFR